MSPAIGIGIPFRRGGGGMSAGETAIRAGNTVAWYDFSDLTTLTKDTGVTEAISRWNDKLLSGHDLIQATGARQPIWSVGGVVYNAPAMCMATVNFGYAQPEMIYLVVKQVTWVADKTIINSTAHGSGTLYQYGVTPELIAHCGGAGATIVENGNFAVGVWGIVRILFNTATSKLIVDDTIPVTGHFGSANMNGIIIGGFSTTSVCANFIIKEAIFRDVADTAGNEAAIYAYLKAKYTL